MKDLSALERGYFDFIFNPCSTCFTDDVRKVWQECSKVIKKGGVLLTGFNNPVALLFGDQEYEDTSDMKLLYKQPYSDLTSVTDELRQKLAAANEPLVFGHSLSDQIGGLTDAGFAVTGFFEDYWGGGRKIDEFFPPFIALKAVKL
jgi:SAM-dependent methyltransferase